MHLVMLHMYRHGGQTLEKFINFINFILVLIGVSNFNILEQQLLRSKLRDSHVCGCV